MPTPPGSHADASAAAGRGAHGHEAHAHDHGVHGTHAHVHMPRGPEAGRRLKIVLVLASAFVAVEVVAGLLSDSLALLADAGHTFTDIGAIALSLVAMRLALRPASPEKTFGYVRMEILAALVNGTVLLLVAGVILWEAVQRMQAPRDVDAPILIAVASAGVCLNLVAAFLLHSQAGHNLNVRGAYLHILGDLLGSVGAIVAGVVILTTGWALADPLISVVIALLILASAWRLVREATDVLLEAAPRHLDVEAILEELRGIPHLHEIHDLHVWTVTSGFVALSAHGVIDDPRHQRPVLDEINRRLAESGIEHVTFQLEPRRLYQISDPLEGSDAQ